MFDAFTFANRILSVKIMIKLPPDDFVRPGKVEKD